MRVVKSTSVTPLCGCSAGTSSRTTQPAKAFQTTWICSLAKLRKNAVCSACVRSSFLPAKERSSCAVRVMFPLTNEDQAGPEGPVKNGESNPLERLKGKVSGMKTSGEVGLSTSSHRPAVGPLLGYLSRMSGYPLVICPGSKPSIYAASTPPVSKGSTCVAY